jgi:hypothetical protein
MNLIDLAAFMTLYLVIILFALWWATDTIHRLMDRTVSLIREQRNEDLRWHRDSLLAHLRAEQAARR